MYAFEAIYTKPCVREVRGSWFKTTRLLLGLHIYYHNRIAFELALKQK